MTINNKGLQIVLSVFTISAIVILSRCTNAKTESMNDIKQVHQEDIASVNIMVLERRPFHREIVSNGKLKAVQKSKLRFSVAGTLRKINVKNGNTVEAGQVIATIDQFEYKQKVEHAKTQLRSASIELESILLGYNAGREPIKDSVPAAIHEAALIRSGYAAALRELETAQFNLENTILKAPFRGRIANLNYRTFEQIGMGSDFCMIIDDKRFEVEFQLIEHEIAQVKLADGVRVIPFASNKEYSGIISEINPLIDENGLVTVKAEVSNNGELWEGMNVKVIIEKAFPDKLVVPKSAIVLRQNQQVLFKYAGRKALWTYVQTDMENSSFFSVVATPGKGGTLSPGDSIIISNNLNLGHQSNVAIKP